MFFLNSSSFIKNIKYNIEKSFSTRKISLYISIFSLWQKIHQMRFFSTLILLLIFVIERNQCLL